MKIRKTITAFCLLAATGIAAFQLAETEPQRWENPNGNGLPDSLARNTRLKSTASGNDRSRERKELRSAVTSPEAMEDENSIREKSRFLELHALRNLAAEDSGKALAGAMAYPEGPARDQALGEVCHGIATKRPGEAVELAGKLRLGSVMDYLVQQWASVDAPAAVAWLKKEPAGPSRDGMTVRIASAMAAISPAEATALILDEMPGGRLQDDALLIVVHQWGNQDNAAAVAWVREFPESPLRNQALAELQLLRERQQAVEGR